MAAAEADSSSPTAAKTASAHSHRTHSPLLSHFHRVRRYLADGGTSPVSHAILSAAEFELRLNGLTRATTYSFRVQAWTAPVDTAVCANGESSQCSVWSPFTNATTQAAGTRWYVAPQGSYLYGEGTLEHPFPMDIQGLIDRSDVANGHEIILLPGVYGDALLSGPGHAQDLNLRGKMLSITGLNGSALTTVDCGGTSRFLTCAAAQRISKALSSHIPPHHRPPPQPVQPRPRTRPVGSQVQPLGAFGLRPQRPDHPQLRRRRRRQGGAAVHGALGSDRPGLRLRRERRRDWRRLRR